MRKMEIGVALIHSFDKQNLKIALIKINVKFNSQSEIRPSINSKHSPAMPVSVYCLVVDNPVRLVSWMIVFQSYSSQLIPLPPYL